MQEAEAKQKRNTIRMYLKMYENWNTIAGVCVRVSELDLKADETSVDKFKLQM